MLPDEIAHPLPADAPTSPRRHPGYGPLCPRCGTAKQAGDHWVLCERMRERPGLWADGWVDLSAFGLDEPGAVGWPEVRTGPIPQVRHGGFGPESIHSTTGPWVRHPDRTVPTWRRVAALAVLEAAGEPLPKAVAKVIAAQRAHLDAWCAPRVVAIQTTGCGATHYVRIERGLPPDRDRCRVSARDRGEILWRFKTSARCEQVIARWRNADVGTVQLDLSADPTDRYRRIGHDEAVLAAYRVLVAATLARVRGNFIDAGEPDRWLVLEGRPGPVGSPALLNESTRQIPIALVTAPATWLWSSEPLG